MGAEFGQTKESNHDQSLRWHLLEHTPQLDVQQFVKDMNHLYTGEKSMHENDYKQEGFEWLDLTHRDDCILIWKRQGKNANDHLIIVGNFDQQTHIDFPVPVLQRNHYVEVISSDAEKYYGSGLLNAGLLKPETIEENTTDDDGNTTLTKRHSLKITIPPLTLIVLKPVLKLRRSKA